MSFTFGIRKCANFSSISFLLRQPLSRNQAAEDPMPSANQHNAPQALSTRSWLPRVVESSQATRLYFDRASTKHKAKRLEINLGASSVEANPPAGSSNVGGRPPLSAKTTAQPDLDKAVNAKKQTVCCPKGKLKRNFLPLCILYCILFVDSGSLQTEPNWQSLNRTTEILNHKTNRTDRWKEPNRALNHTNILNLGKLMYFLVTEQNINWTLGFRSNRLCDYLRISNQWFDWTIGPRLSISLATTQR